MLENGPFEFRIHESVPNGLANFVDHAVEQAFKQIEEDKTLPGVADFPLLNQKESKCNIL